MIKIQREPGTNLIYTQAVDKLDQADYDRLLPVVKEMTEKYGKVRWYFEMNDFDGWTPQALWSDATFSLKHRNDFSKTAMVGRKDWMNWLTQMMKPFTTAEVRFFELHEREAAKAWIKQ